MDHIAEPLRPLAVPCDSLTIDPANARLHPEQNLQALVASLRVYGQRKPIVVNRRTQVVEAGNGTLAAVRVLGWTHLAVVFVDDDPAVAAGFSITDNRTAELAKWDIAALDRLLREVETGDESLAAMLSALAEDEGLIPQDEPDDDDAPEEVPEGYQVLVNCAGDREQVALLEELTQRGFECRALLT